ncbi:hypothetical protein EWM64_g3651 [Hericium alpestre]|uniref:AP180 N-terminal homology (ANTH) domain-containing protein n=1 Tax=Hericium alpestre TaxID=135208 RepID=A0A4Y9ZZV4_9AGAM|nr:hypothetical protein EWM64_g3651 [Hericium alpestre]
MYLDSRIKGYRDLKHDAILVQSESNRDARLSISLEEDARRNGRSRPDPKPLVNIGGPIRSKTIMGRKLRVMTVDKGLLRETKTVQKMIDALVECRFYLDDLEDELSLTALRMLVKDLLILFQAGNEGVINVLEHYFEMSHVDAESALAIYRHFCKQTEHVVEYLGVAKKLQNLLNVPIPNMKHAPVSLVGALEEYLNDPNFEQNRIEYKTNKDAAERSERAGGNAKLAKVEKAPTPKAESAKPNAPSSSSGEPKPEAGKALADFFSAIEEEQHTMFNPATHSPTSNYFQQQAAYNPFVHPQATGSFPSQPFGQPQMQAQPTGFMQPQFTAMPSFQQQQQQQQQPQPQPPNPFQHPQQQQPQQQQPQQQQPQQQPQPNAFSPFLRPQTTGFLHPQSTGFLQPQATGSNPFRQSMLFPHTTGSQPFNAGNPMQPTPTGGNNSSPTQGRSLFQQNSAPATQPNFAQQQPSSSPFPPAPRASGPSARSAANQFMATPARPSSTPITAITNRATSPLQQVKTHQTGSRNPFGPVMTTPPPVPKQPTLMELTMGFGSDQTQQHQQQQHQQQQPQQVQPQQTGFNITGMPMSSSPAPQGAGMAGVASSFTFNKDSKPEDKKPSLSTSGLPNFLSNSSNSSPLTSQMTSTTTTGSNFSDSIFSALSSQPTGVTSGTGPGSAFNPTSPPVRSHTTGFSGIKAFKPTSSFGASLLESLPPIPQSQPGTPNLSGQPTGVSGGNSSSNPTSPLPPFGGIGNGTGGNTGGGIGSFNTGAGGGAGAGGFNPQSTGFPSLNSQPTGAGGGFQSFGGAGDMGKTTGVGLRPQMTGGGANPFRATMFATGAGGPFGGQSGAFGGPTSNSTPAFNAGGGAPLFPQTTGGNPFGAFRSGQQSQQQQHYQQQQQQQQHQQHQQQNGTASLI